MKRASTMLKRLHNESKAIKSKMIRIYAKQMQKHLNAKMATSLNVSALKIETKQINRKVILYSAKSAKE
jgi:hypothetical protein